MVDIVKYGGNNKKVLNTAISGRLDFNLVGGMGTVASGETYKVGVIPANAVITAVKVVVTTGFGSDGTTDSTANIGTTSGGSDLGSGVVITNAGVLSVTADIYTSTEVGVYITPSLTGTPVAGNLKVIVEFVETEAYTAMFTA